MDLSILIPARNEPWLAATIEDALRNMRGNTEIIAVLDGEWARPPIPDHERVTLIYHPRAVGQRAAVNEAARLSKAKYILKVDAHCSFAEGFDLQLLGECAPDWTVIPRMYNLHVYDWECQECGNRTYQGPKPEVCEKCGCANILIQMVWGPRMTRRTDFARFDRDLHFQYWRDYERRVEAQGDLAEVMCFVGACFMMEKRRYFELGGLDEGHGSWGQMGVEISCKTWLSGGRMVVNKKTWFAHLFRTQPGFGFPYPISVSEQEAARAYSRRLWNLADPERLPEWKPARYPLAWLVDKFAPVPEWHDGQTDHLLHLQHAPAGD